MSSAYKPARQAAKEAIKANPHRSNRAIAEEIGVSDDTVARARKGSAVTDVTPDAVIGRDGKSYTTTRAPRSDAERPAVTAKLVATQGTFGIS